MATTPVYQHLDFLKASQIINALLHPTASDPSSPGTGQFWFNTSQDRLRGYDGSVNFTIPRIDGADTITGIWNYNPSSGSVPFTVHSSKTGLVQNLNADQLDGADASEAATGSSVALRTSAGALFVSTPTDNNHAATKAYVDAAGASKTFIDPVDLATTANITLSGEQTIDGTLTSSSRVLVKNQSTASENGVYVSNSGAWTRATDQDEDSEVVQGVTTTVQGGSTQAGHEYTLTTANPITVGTTGQTWTLTGVSATYGDGRGIVQSGTTFHFAQDSDYTIGALPYASGTTTIGFVAPGSSGLPLLSQGSGSAPAYGTLNLAIAVTGTLPVGNGGTGTSTTFTQGAVIFAGASGVYSQDPSVFFWDASNNRLGLGTNAPSKTFHLVGNAFINGLLGVGIENAAYKLDVAGTFRVQTATAPQARFYGSNDDGVSMGFHIDDAGTKASVYAFDENDGGTSAYANLWLGHNSTALLVLDPVNFRVGVGIAAPAGRLHVYENTSETGAAAGITIEQDGTGDAILNYVLTGVRQWTVGVDNSDSDKFKIESSVNLGSLAEFTIDSLNSRIGILNASPTKTLEVGGEIRSASSTAQNSVYTVNTAAANIANLSGFEGRCLSSTAEREVFQILGNFTDITDASRTGRLRIYVADNGALNPVFNVTGRKVGFNVAFPTDQFEVYHSASFYSLLTSDAANSSVGWKFTNDVNTWTIGVYGSDDSFVIADNAGLGSNHRLAIDTTGKVSIPSIITNSQVVNSLVVHNSGQLGTRTANSAIWSGATIWRSDNDGAGTGLDADLLDGQHGTFYLDLANSVGDTDDVAEGVVNFYFTDARARAALSSESSEEIAYNDTTGVIGLGTQAGRVKSFDVGDGSSTSIALTHSLGTRDVIVQVHQKSSPYAMILVYHECNSTSQVTLVFNTAPSLNEFRATICAANG